MCQELCWALFNYSTYLFSLLRKLKQNHFHLLFFIANFKFYSQLPHLLSPATSKECLEKTVKAGYYGRARQSTVFALCCLKYNFPNPY